MLDDLEFRESKDISAQQLMALFRQEQWNDFMEPDEVKFYLQTALYVVTAWKENEPIGFARLVGDGRIDVEISDVLVKTEFQGQGIGTELVRRLVEHIRILDPYYIQVNPIGDREVHLYSKFGFTVMPGFIKMELDNPKLTRKIEQVRGHQVAVSPDSTGEST